MPSWQDMAGLTQGGLAELYGFGGGEYDQYFQRAPEDLVAGADPYSDYWDPFRQQQTSFLQEDYGRGMTGLQQQLGGTMGGLRSMFGRQGVQGASWQQRAGRQARQQGQQGAAGLWGNLGRGMFGMEQDILGRAGQMGMQGAQWAAQQAQMAMGLMGAGAEGQGTGISDINMGSSYTQKDPAGYFTDEMFGGMSGSEQDYLSRYEWSPNYGGGF